MLATLDKTTYLGPARVLSVAGNRAKVELPDAHVWAVVALAATYALAADDEVLVIGREGGWYVIGLIHGQGPTTLTAPGDLCIRAPRGAIELSASRGVSVRAPEVTIAADLLKVVAKSLFERLTSATRWVKDALQLRAGRVRARVDGVYDVAADRIQQRAQRDVRIDGSKIHLG